MALKIYDETACAYVLSDDFIDRLRSDHSNDLTTSAKLKLLNINACVKLFMPTYNGAMLDSAKHKDIYESQIVYTNDKQLLIKAMVDALKSLVPGDQLQINIDSKMGFTIGKITKI